MNQATAEFQQRTGHPPSVSELCRELGILPVTLYRYVGPQGQLREEGQKVLAT